ncbi:MAG: matrixin family metalloprotease [Oscillospiraceae bacterium]
MRNIKKILAVFFVCAVLIAALPQNASAACTHSSLGERYSEASHPHAYFSYCNSCGAKVYTGGYATKAHGDGTWGSGTCPDCGTHTYVGQSCTSSGVCACGATVAALGHNLGQRYSEATHPHYYYKNCSRCGAKVYIGGQETKAHGTGEWGSGTCPDCGTHTYVGLSCTTGGVCVCGATAEATGHTLVYDEVEDEYRCDCGVSILSWNLVDSGKHLDYSGDSAYMYLFDEAKDVWNAYKPGVIRKDTILTGSDVSVEDVYIADISSDSGFFARTKSSGIIQINTYYFDNDEVDGITVTDEKRLKTVIHELGHALGLGHSTGSNDVMRQGPYAIITLSNNDKASYDEAYKRY